MLDQKQTNRKSTDRNKRAQESQNSMQLKEITKDIKISPKVMTRTYHLPRESSANRQQK